MRIRHISGLAAALMALLGSEQPWAQSGGEFYQGKTIRIYIGYAPGGGFDYNGRLLARHLGKHIPGQPNVIPINMPGAGSFIVANFLYSTAPQDGTAIGIVSQGIALEEVLKKPGIKSKSSEFNWIGRITSAVNILMTSTTSAVRTVADARVHEISVASTGLGSNSDLYLRVLNGFLGTRFKIVSGYPGLNDAVLAFERGEVEGLVPSLNYLEVFKPDWLAKKIVNVLAQFTSARRPEMPNVPTLTDLARTPQEKEILALYASPGDIGFSFFTTPGTPRDRVETLRRAFDLTMDDPKFREELKKSSGTLEPMSGEQLQALIDGIRNVPSSTVEEINRVMNRKN